MQVIAAELGFARCRDRHGEGTAQAARGTYILVSMGKDGRPKALAG